MTLIWFDRDRLRHVPTSAACRRAIVEFFAQAPVSHVPLRIAEMLPHPALVVYATLMELHAEGRLEVVQEPYRPALIGARPRRSMLEAHYRPTKTLWELSDWHEQGDPKEEIDW